MQPSIEASIKYRIPAANTLCKVWPSRGLNKRKTVSHHCKNNKDNMEQKDAVNMKIKCSKVFFTLI